MDARKRVLAEVEAEVMNIDHFKTAIELYGRKQRKQQEVPDGLGGHGFQNYATIAQHSYDRALREGRLTKQLVLDMLVSRAYASCDPGTGVPTKNLGEYLRAVARVAIQWVAEIESRSVVESSHDGV